MGHAPVMSMTRLATRSKSWRRIEGSKANARTGVDLVVVIGRLLLIDRQKSARYGDFMDYMKLITIEPDKRSGQPCIRGLRLTVQDVLEYMASGMSPDEILADFPDLTAEDIRACLAFAADRERRLRVVPVG